MCVCEACHTVKVVIHSPHAFRLPGARVTKSVSIESEVHSSQGTSFGDEPVLLGSERIVSLDARKQSLRLLAAEINGTLGTGNSGVSSSGSGSACASPLGGLRPSRIRSTGKPIHFGKGVTRFVVICGWMSKRGEGNTAWRHRYFVLLDPDHTEAAPCLSEKGADPGTVELGEAAAAADGRASLEALSIKTATLFYFGSERDFRKRE